MKLINRFYLTFLLISSVAFLSPFAKVVLADDSVITKPAQLYVSGQNWHVEYNVNGFKGVNFTHDDNSVMVQYNKEKPFFMSVIVSLMKDAKSASVENCRDAFYDFLKTDTPNINVTKGMFQKMPTLSYIIKTYEGETVNMKYTHAFIFKNHICGSIVAAKEDYKQADEKYLTDILKSFKIKAGKPKLDLTDVKAKKDKTAKDYYLIGSDYYRNDDWGSAIKNYRQAYNIDKKTGELDYVSWTILTDNLGMAYGLNGDLDKSITLYKEAIQINPEYPMFFYNIACTYAEKGNELKAIDNLNKAYFYRKNMLPGEKYLPDPFTDNSFRNMLKNKDFLKIAELIRGSREL